MTVVPTGNWSSSNALTTTDPSRSNTTTSDSYDSTQWSSAASLFSALSYQENTSWSLPSATTTNWLLVDVGLVLPPVYERQDPTAWLKLAKCQGLPSNLFYADHQHNGQVSEAKSVCLGTHPDHPGRCPVLDQCLDHALANGEKWGVWGGCSERERRKLRRERHRDAAIEAGIIISISTATRHRRQLARIIRNQQARDPAPWRRSKGLIDQRRRLRAEERRTASIGDVPLGMVSQG